MTAKIAYDDVEVGTELPARTFPVNRADAGPVRGRLRRLQPDPLEREVRQGGRPARRHRARHVHHGRGGPGGHRLGRRPGRRRRVRRALHQAGRRPERRQRARSSRWRQGRRRSWTTRPVGPGRPHGDQRGPEGAGHVPRRGPPELVPCRGGALPGSPGAVRCPLPGRSWLFRGCPEPLGCPLSWLGVPSSGAGRACRGTRRPGSATGGFPVPLRCRLSLVPVPSSSAGRAEFCARHRGSATAGCPVPFRSRSPWLGVPSSSAGRAGCGARYRRGRGLPSVGPAPPPGYLLGARTTPLQLKEAPVCSSRRLRGHPGTSPTNAGPARCGKWYLESGQHPAPGAPGADPARCREWYLESGQQPAPGWKIGTGPPAPVGWCGEWGSGVAA